MLKSYLSITFFICTGFRSAAVKPGKKILRQTVSLHRLKKDYPKGLLMGKWGLQMNRGGSKLEFFHYGRRRRHWIDAKALR